ncbi:hypothetical protein D516_4298 [Rhodobacter sp. AKP1]|nr:hypothetical protein D516_4298 [Rhodobacter sp. AKP1]
MPRAGARFQPLACGPPSRAVMILFRKGCLAGSAAAPSLPASGGVP